MNLSDNAKILLVGIFHQTQGARRAKIPERQSYHDAKWFTAVRAQALFRDVGVPYDLPRYLRRRPTHSERSSFARTLETLQRHKLLVRGSSGRGARTTHVKLRPAGAALAKELIRERRRSGGRAESAGAQTTGAAK